MWKTRQKYMKELGHSPEKAMDRAVADMGDPVETGVQLDLVHQPRLDKKLLWMIVGIWFLGGLFQFLAWAMGVFGTQRIFQVDRIVVYFVILLGFVYMAVRKYDLSREKELEQNWIILILTGSILGILDIFLFQNTGKFALIKVVAFAMALEGYAFLTFRYRNQGKEKRNQLFFMAGISCLASCLTGSYFFALLYMLGYTWILTIAFERKWYPKEKAIYAKETVDTSRYSCSDRNGNSGKRMDGKPVRSGSCVLFETEGYARIVL